MGEYMKYEKYLPIGTVVMLEKGYKRVMITGYKCFEKNNRSNLYDYSGCLYPEGIVSSNNSLLFNHDQIIQVYHLGFINDSFKSYNMKLLKL